MCKKHAVSEQIKDRDGQKYLYIRKRVGSRLTSTYVNTYSDELYQLLLRTKCWRNGRLISCKQASII